jgi:hypothetical protein
MPELIVMVKEKLNTQTMSVPALSAGTFFKGSYEPAKAMFTKPRGLLVMGEILGEESWAGKLLRNSRVFKIASKTGSAH